MEGIGARGRVPIVKVWVKCDVNFFSLPQFVGVFGPDVVCGLAHFGVKGFSVFAELVMCRELPLRYPVADVVVADLQKSRRETFRTFQQVRQKLVVFDLVFRVVGTNAEGGLEGHLQRKNI